MKLVLFTAECAQVGEAIEAVIERHHEHLAMVVTSDIYGGARGGLIRQTWRSLLRSGPAFVNYLAFSFLYYPLFVKLDALRSALTGRPRRRRSVAELCRSHGIAHVHAGNINDAALVDRLQQLAPDFLLVYWFDQIMREALIAVPKRGVINVHAAYLPRCKGLFPGLYSALENHASGGTQPFGISAHLIENRDIDAGPVLAQRQSTPPAGRSVLLLDAWVNRDGVEMLDTVLADFDSLKAAAVAQAAGSYYSYPRPGQLRDLRRQGGRLFSLMDYFSVLRGLPRNTD